MESKVILQLSEVYWLTKHIRNQIRTNSWLRTENKTKYISETNFF